MAKDLLPQRSLRVLRLERAARLQFGYQQIDNCLQALRHHDPGQIETVDVRLLHPGLQFIRNGRGGADNKGPASADLAKTHQVAHSPATIGTACGDRFDQRSHGIAFDMLDWFVRIVTGQVDTGPTGQQRQSPLIVHPSLVFSVFVLSLGICWGNDNGGTEEDLDVIRPAPLCHSLTADIPYRLCDQGPRVAIDEYRLGVAAGESASCGRRTCLEQERRSLR